MFYLTTHSTHFIDGYMALDPPQYRNEGNVLFNDALSTFYLRLYGFGPTKMCRMIKIWSV